MNGTQLAAWCYYGPVIAWSYPSGEILFQMKGHAEWVAEIEWNPFRQDVFAASHWVRNAADCLFHCLLFEGRRKSFLNCFIV